MLRSMMIAGAVIACGLSQAGADPGKDESGKSRWQSKYARYGDDDRRSAGRRHRDNAIPYGHLPPPGECRRWYRGRPAGHQPPPFRC